MRGRVEGCWIARQTAWRRPRTENVTGWVIDRGLFYFYFRYSPATALFRGIEVSNKSLILM